MQQAERRRDPRPSIRELAASDLRALREIVTAGAGAGALLAVAVLCLAGWVERASGRRDLLEIEEE